MVGKANCEGINSNIESLKIFPSFQLFCKSMEVPEGGKRSRCILGAPTWDHT